MNIKFFCPRWGSTGLSWDDFLSNVKDAGYDGVEYGIANSTPASELEMVCRNAEQVGLLLIAQHYETSDLDINIHADNFAAWYRKIEPFNWLKVDSQTGKDFFTFQENIKMIDVASAFSDRTGIPVYHETHRGKFPFAAHITKEYLQRLPDLKLTLDISHWVNVAESFLENQPEAVELALQRAGHLHARVGYPEGPQIPDPRSPEWQEALNIHLQWWDKVVHRINSQSDDNVVTITPEFGPHPYMVHLPGTGLPIADQWDVNVFMMQLLKERYS
jgi:sugar phosphate isomerase/epimerase